MTEVPANHIETSHILMIIIIIIIIIINYACLWRSKFEKSFPSIIDNLETLFCWKEGLDENENRISCFTEEKVTIRYSKSLEFFIFISPSFKVAQYRLFFPYIWKYKKIRKWNTGADPAFLIRGDLIQKFSCQILGNYSKESSFL